MRSLASTFRSGTFETAWIRTARWNWSAIAEMRFEVFSTMPDLQSVLGN